MPLTWSVVTLRSLCCHESLVDTQTHGTLKRLPQLFLFSLHLDLLFLLHICLLSTHECFSYKDLHCSLIFVALLVSDHHLREAGVSVGGSEAVRRGDGVLVPSVHSLQLLGADARLLALLQQQLVLRHLYLGGKTGCAVLMSYQSLQHHRVDRKGKAASKKRWGVPTCIGFHRCSWKKTC